MCQNEPNSRLQLETREALTSDGFVSPPAIEPNRDMWHPEKSATDTLPSAPRRWRCRSLEQVSTPNWRMKQPCQYRQGHCTGIASLSRIMDLPSGLPKDRDPPGLPRVESRERRAQLDRRELREDDRSDRRPEPDRRPGWDRRARAGAAGLAGNGYGHAQDTLRGQPGNLHPVRGSPAHRRGPATCPEGHSPPPPAGALPGPDARDVVGRGARGGRKHGACGLGAVDRPDRRLSRLSLGRYARRPDSSLGRFAHRAGVFTAVSMSRWAAVPGGPRHGSRPGL